MRHPLHVAVLLALFFSPAGAWAADETTTEAPAPGGAAPRFTAQLLDGNDFDLGHFLGQKAVVLDFWSIYCVSCVQQIPTLIDLFSRYSDQVEVIGVNLDSFGTRRVAQFVKGFEHKVPYTIVIDKNRQAAAKYGVTELPTTVLIDRQGLIHYYHIGYSPGDEAAMEARLRRAVAIP